MEGLFTAENLIVLFTLTMLEIVLGVNNVIFISILAGKWPQEQQARARQIGVGLTLVTRILLLLSISWITSLTTPLFSIVGREISGRDLILLGGELFLLGKATFEIHEKLEGEEGHGNTHVTPSFTAVIIQIPLLDVVFSLDSVITAVGMVNEVWVMITAVVIAIVVMLLAAWSISDFVNRHPTVKMLALSFLLFIGFSLVVEGIHVYIPKVYIYFAVGFSVMVEMLNLQLRRKTKPLELRKTYTESPEASH